MNGQIKNVIQDCNLNFLIGSGLSSPYLSTLGNIESLLEELEQKQMDENAKSLIRASLYKKYFDAAISKNLDLLGASDPTGDVLGSYREFLKTLNSILLRRKSTILSKEVNLFTTNIDIFLEKALEDLGLEFNDGFNGRFQPSFSLSNFKKSRFKKSLHYDNTSEIPVFNLLKLHGALTWKIAGRDRILFSSDLGLVKSIKNTPLVAGSFLAVNESSTIATLATAAAGKRPTANALSFMGAYDKLTIVNPTKTKFMHTLLNQTYYELLRIYSNELEKENTVLFALGFSFADEHIREITLRAANSNPTLMIYVIAYNAEAHEDLSMKFSSEAVKNDNVQIIAPSRTLNEETESEEDDFTYDFSAINAKVFGSLFAAEDAALDPAPAAESQ